MVPQVSAVPAYLTLVATYGADIVLDEQVGELSNNFSVLVLADAVLGDMPRKSFDIVTQWAAPLLCYLAYVAHPSPSSRLSVAVFTRPRLIKILAATITTSLRDGIVRQTPNNGILGLLQEFLV
jgi:hypothetical protein